MTECWATSHALIRVITDLLLGHRVGCDHAPSIITMSRRTALD